MITLPLEALLGLTVLFFSAYISMTTPPFTVSAYTFEAASDDFVLDVHPYEEEMFRIELRDVDGEATLTAVAENILLGIGPNVLPLEKRTPHTYVFPRTELSPAGDWEIRVIEQRPGAYDRVSSFFLTYPDDIDATKYSHESRSFDTYAKELLFFGISFLLLCFILLGHAVVQKRKQKSPVFNYAYAPFHTLATIFIVVLMCGVYTTVLYLIPGASFERICKEGGHEWIQTYPVRNFERTSQNTYVGCNVHHGHFHFVDEEEYRTYITPLR
jgi:hypothetical protein